MTTLLEAWHAARRQLPDPESASLEAQLLLCHVLHIERTTLLAHGERLLEAEPGERYAALIQRRAAGEPYAYLVGDAHFYDLVLTVNASVLIPRPETELLVEAAIAAARQRSAPVIADIGTGSGAIAVTVARSVPSAQVHAVDISPAALAVARANAQRWEAAVTFHQGDLAAPLIAAGLRVDLLLANLPYIADAEVPTLAVSQHEPTLALAGGADGLALIRRLLAQVPQVCNEGALVLLEIGSGQGAATLAAASGLALASAEVLPDYAGHERIVRLQLAAGPHV